jgi:hypothetical protein
LPSFGSRPPALLLWKRGNLAALPLSSRVFNQPVAFPELSSTQSDASLSSLLFVPCIHDF